MDIEQIIREAAEYIHRMFDEPITIADLASQAYLSPSYFSALFRVLTGYTVKNYLNRYRLYRAASDLICSKKPIVEIAYVNGFSSQQAFTKSFSQMYGIAPAQFRVQSPPLDPFPPDYLWKEHKPNMELMECFENVTFIHKDALHAHYATFNKYPAIEVYPTDWKDEQSLMQIFAPIVKKS